jgi:hypothetical protein
MPKHVNFLVKFLQTFIMLPDRPARASKHQGSSGRVPGSSGTSKHRLGGHRSGAGRRVTGWHSRRASGWRGRRLG